MSGRLRSILGGSNRVKKKSRTPRDGGGKSSNRASPSASWSDSLRRTKPGTPGPSEPSTPQGHECAPGAPAPAPGGPLPDAGGSLALALATDLTLRDVPQAMRHASDRMFAPLPAQPSSYGLGSARVADVLRLRRRLPRLTTAAHLHALLARRGPTAVERETAELVRAGAVRRVVVLRRGAAGAAAAGGGVVELLVEGGELGRLVDGSGELDEGTKEAFAAWLRANPSSLRVSAADVDPGPGGDGGGGLLRAEQVDQLVRAGFLTTYHDLDMGNASSGFARPEDRRTLLSLEAVSRAAAGSFAAVGGEGAVHSSGGTGGARSGGPRSRPGAGGGGGSDLSLAVPGQGAYLKLMAAALSHVTGILGKSPYREMPEGLLRERWDGGVAGSSKQHAGKKGRREFAGVLPGRTKKWKDFYGLTFDWALHEAVGNGLVELFETGSVGRAVRLL